MCGVAGIVGRESERYRPNLEAMLSSILHRGPDGSGMVFHQNCALGHVRLSIVDIEGGRQPMLDPSNQTSVTFNGEIYGYERLKKRIRFPYQTKSDTELLLALYSEHGIEMVKSLPGMFAFALWDESKQRLFAARDRFGEKPFYYARGPEGELIFASEIKAILASGLVNPIIDFASLGHYLKKLYVPANRSIYANVYCLPPAHSLTCEQGQIRISRYWNLPVPDETCISLDSASEQFAHLLDEAVKRQLMADVPVGAFLSGGLDSSTIVALAAKEKPAIKTLSFGFDGETDELPFAREIAEKYRTDHREFRDTKLPLPALLLQMASVYDEPFADSSNIPTYVICQHAARELKVVLTGDGGDELFAGYDFWYKPLLMHGSGICDWRHHFLYSAARLAAKFRLPITNSLAESAACVPIGKYKSMIEAHSNQNCFFQTSELDAMGIPVASSILPDTFYGGLDDALRMDIVDYMPGDILTKTDRASMAHGLELRSPFLDVDFASFALSLPSILKINSIEDKVILRKAFSAAWTPAVQKRAKQGFGAPVSAWMQRDDMKPLLSEYLANRSKKIFGLFDSRLIHKVAREKSYRTWIFLVLSIWLEANAVVV